MRAAAGACFPTLERALAKLPSAVADQLRALLTPENVAALVVILGVWAASHALGIGEIMDLILALGGVIMLDLTPSAPSRSWPSSRRPRSVPRAKPISTRRALSPAFSRSSRGTARMSISYTYYTASSLKPEQAMQLIAQTLGAQLSGPVDLRTPNSLVIHATEQDPGSRGEEMIEEGFGFRPSLRVGFRLAKEYEARERDRELAHAATVLLEAAAGDAVLLVNGEHVLLQRLGGRLELSPGWAEALQTARAFPTLRHEVRSIPSPL